MIEELKKLRDNVEREYNTITDHIWISERLKVLKTQFELLDKLIKESEEHNAATSSTEGRNKSRSNSNSR